MSPFGRLIPSSVARKDYLGGISRFAEIRMHERREAPPRIKIGGRYFYPELQLNEWLLSRLEKPLPTSKKGVGQ
jgi:hypothetical protein